MKKIAIIQARMGSTRFPGKVLKSLNGKPLLQWVVERTLKIPTLEHVIVATTDTQLDDQIADWCNNNKIAMFRGSELNVLKRFYDAAQHHFADIVLRITADCPLLDPYIAGQVLYLVSSGGADYASNTQPPTWPDGLDCEAFTITALTEAFHKATRDSDREHVTPYIRNNQHKFKTLNVPSPIQGLQKHRWTVDSKEDLDFIELLVTNTAENATTYDFLETLQNNKHIMQPNHIRNEGFNQSLKKESIHCDNFDTSKALLQRALNTIPLGSQTFSKSHIQYPENSSPFFLTHGSGARVWDVDGNEYIDLVSSLLPTVLGYNDPDVNYAIQTQLHKGITFSLATALELQLAEKLCEIIPSAEKVRFAKNGTDVTSAAIRLARAYTHRDKIMVCGYHGWQDWYIGTTTRNKGVPKAVSDLSFIMPHNDLNMLEKLLSTEEFAAIILEPRNVVIPETDYLQSIKDLCEKFGTLVIFDEVVTGFRFALGGAQQYFGVSPHLSCFGKAMANGMPISAIVGQNHIMAEMEEIFFSGTFGGETLSIAAALATIEKLTTRDIISHLWSYGNSLAIELEPLIAKYELSSVIKLSGYAPLKTLQFFDHPNGSSAMIKTLFLQEIIARGILMNSSFNISFSHGDLEKTKILTAVDEVLSIISQGLNTRNFSNLLRSPNIEPIFKVR